MKQRSKVVYQRQLTSKLQGLSFPYESRTVKMRLMWLNRDDFEMFHQDITPLEYEFFRTHADTFKRMWKEQTRHFWTLFVNTFEHFIWTHGCVKDFPMKSTQMCGYVNEILQYIRDQFVEGKVSTAKNLVCDCVTVTQNRHCITILDRAAYSQNPFFMKETREVFRQLFGAPSDKRTYMKVLCGLPMYVKFAGAAVVALRRWMDAPEIDSDDEDARWGYLEGIYARHKGLRLSANEDPRHLGNLKIPGFTDGLDVMSGTDCGKGASVSSSESESKKRKKRKKKKKSSETVDNPLKTGEDVNPEKPDSVKHEHSDPLKAEIGDLTKCNIEPGGHLKTKNDGLTSTEANDPVKVESDSPDVVRPSEPVKDDCSDPVGEAGGCVKSDDGVAGKPVNGDTSTMAGDTDGTITVDNVKKHETSDLTDSSESKAVLSELKLPPDKSNSDVQVKPKEHSSDSAIGSEVETAHDGQAEDTYKNKHSPKVVTERKDHVLLDEQRDRTSKVDEPATQDKARPMEEGRGGGVGEENAARKKLHMCGLCGLVEVTAKTFKRCQKCRGKSNPKYYCSRECQVKHWKMHKYDHKDDA